LALAFWVSFLYFDKYVYSVRKQPAGEVGMIVGGGRKEIKETGGIKTKTEHEKPKVSVSAITMLGLYMYL
jgi:hypothetical protein